MSRLPQCCRGMDEEGGEWCSNIRGQQAVLVEDTRRQDRPAVSQDLTGRQNGGVFVEKGMGGDEEV